MVSLTFFDLFNDIIFLFNLLLENCIFFYIWVASIFVWFMIDITVLYVDYFNNKHAYISSTNNIIILFFINKFFKEKNIKLRYLKLVSNVL